MKKTLFWGIILLITTTVVSSNNAGFVIVNVATALLENAYRLTAQIDYAFTDTVLEALDNGVPLTIQMRIQVRHKQAWFWEPNVVEITKLSLIRYQPLTEMYTVTHPPDGLRQNFVTRSAAIASLGEIDGLFLMPGHGLNASSQYVVRLKVSLDLDALPLPLRPVAHLTPSWNLSSGWTIWPLNP